MAQEVLPRLEGRGDCRRPSAVVRDELALRPLAVREATGKQARLLDLELQWGPKTSAQAHYMDAERQMHTQFSEEGVAVVQAPLQSAMYTMTGPIACSHWLAESQHTLDREDGECSLPVRGNLRTCRDGRGLLGGAEGRSVGVAGERRVGRGGDRVVRVPFALDAGLSRRGVVGHEPGH